MDQYIAALESFDKECNDLYADILMSHMIATESVGATLKAKVKEAWRKLQELARTIWTKVQQLGRVIKEGVSKMIAMFNKSPDSAEGAEASAKAVAAEEKFGDAQLEAIEQCCKIIEELSDKLRLDDKMALAFDEDNLKALADQFREVRDLYEKANAERKDALQALMESKDEFTEARYDLHKSREQMLREELIGRQAGLVKTVDETNTRINAAKERKGLDSYIEGEVAPATEASAPRKISFSNIKSKLGRNGKKAEDGISKADSAINKLRNVIDGFVKRADSSEDTADDNRKQSTLNRALSLLTQIATFLKGIPGAIAEAFKSAWRFIPRGNGSKVEKYEGPSPVKATDSYGVQVEIG